MMDAGKQAKARGEKRKISPHQPSSIAYSYHGVRVGGDLSEIK